MDDRACDAILDAVSNELAGVAVRLDYAEAATDEIAPDGYRYRIRVFWDRLNAIAR